MKADSQTERAVLESLDKLLAAYSTGKVDEAMKYISKDDDVTLFEPGPDLISVGQDQMRKTIQLDYDTTDGDNPIKFRRRWVSALGDVAWVNGEFDLEINHKGQKMVLDTRISAIAKKEDGQWRFHTAHIGAPNPEHSPGEQWPSQVGVRSVEGTARA